MKKIKRFLLPSFLLLLLPFVSNSQYQVRPFYHHNLSPLIHFYSLQGNEGPQINEKGEFVFRSHLNLVSNASSKRISNERIYLDGEMYRMDLSFRYGVCNWFELGVDLPLVRHSAGRMDRMISNWHETFDLPGRAREAQPYNDMAYVYSINGSELVHFQETTNGIGDVSLMGAFQLYKRKGMALSLRTALKFATGDKDRLVGSGTNDLSLQVNGSIGSAVGNKGTLFFYSFGMLLPGSGGLLGEIQRKQVYFGSLSWAFGIGHRIIPKLQMDWNSPLYKGTLTKQLGKASVQLGGGAEFVLNAKTGFEFAIFEDLVANTSPDFVIQIGFTRKF